MNMMFSVLQRPVDAHRLRWNAQSVQQLHQFSMRWSKKIPTQRTLGARSSRMGTGKASKGALLTKKVAGLRVLISKINILMFLVKELLMG